METRTFTTGRASIELTGEPYKDNPDYIVGVAYVSTPGMIGPWRYVQLYKSMDEAEEKLKQSYANH